MDGLFLLHYSKVISYITLTVFPGKKRFRIISEVTSGFLFRKIFCFGFSITFLCYYEMAFQLNKFFFLFTIILNAIAFSFRPIS